MKYLSSVVFVLSMLCFSKVAEAKTRKSTKTFDPVAQALSHFSFDLFGNITKDLEDDENMAFSPISLFSVFSMLVEGLDGQSLAQVERLLYFDRLRMRHPAFKESQMCRSVFAPSNEYTLTQANRLFADRRLDDIRPEYKNIVARKFKAPIKYVNFANSQQARNKINRFVARRTKNLIPQLLEDGSVSSDTKFVILNTIYMEAKWEYPFLKDEFGSVTQPFHISESETVNVTFMTSPNARCITKESDSLQADVLILPFVGNFLRMVIYVPKEIGDFSRFQQPLSSMLVTSEEMMLTAASAMRLCHISMPKFNVSHRLEDLTSLLQSMGVVDIFDENLGNFTRLTSTDGLFVQNIAHKTVLEVNENGVKATASSAITAGIRMAFPNIIIDKPFLFLIRHLETGAILFIGRVVRP